MESNADGDHFRRRSLPTEITSDNDWRVLRLGDFRPFVGGGIAWLVHLRQSLAESGGSLGARERGPSARGCVVRVMLRAQFMGVVRLAVWAGAFLVGLAGTVLRRLDVSRRVNRLVHPHAVFDPLSRQAQVSAEASSAMDVAHHNGMRLIEQCDAGTVANSRPAAKVR